MENLTTNPPCQRLAGCGKSKNLKQKQQRGESLGKVYTMAIICKNCGRPILGNVVKAKTGSWFSYQEYSCCGEKCRAELEANFAAKKEAKEAKKAAKQAAREEEAYESEGGSSSSGELPSGCVKIVGMILAFLVVCGILGALFYKNEDANDPAVKMAKWEEHLEKRRAAFAEGLSEEGVEARGLKNFTWEEWQNRSKAKAAEKVEDVGELWSAHQKKRREFINAGHTKDEADAAGLVNYTLDEFKQNYKNIKYKTQEDIGEKYREHMNKRMSLLNGGLTDKDVHEMGYDDYTLDAFKQNYKNIKYKTLEEIRQSAAVPASPAAVPEKAAVPAAVTDSVNAETEAKAKAEDEAKAKREAAIREKLEAKERMKAEAEAKAKAKADAEAKARAKSRTEAKARADAAAKAEVEARAKAQKEAKAKAEADKKGAAVEDAVGEQQNGADRSKASKDSKGIALVVEGKGKTNDAAIRSAIHKAVFRAVGRWVDSKDRMEEKGEEVKSVVSALAEGDVNKFEVQETQQQDGGYVLKVKVYISKKKIAPKFEKVFPDVFGNN